MGAAVRYLSQCPHCETTYELSLMQLNISQGKVRCAQCQKSFDAYSCFIMDPEYQAPPVSNFLTEILSESNARYEDGSTPPTPYIQTKECQYVEEIMSQSIKGSRLNLYTYLNHLDTLSPIHSQTRKQTSTSEKATLSFDEQTQIQQRQRDKFTYYLIWGSVNLLLILLFVFQLMLFNFGV